MPAYAQAGAVLRARLTDRLEWSLERTDKQAGEITVQLQMTDGVFGVAQVRPLPPDTDAKDPVYTVDIPGGFSDTIPGLDRAVRAALMHVFGERLLHACTPARAVADYLNS